MKDIIDGVELAPAMFENAERWSSDDEAMPSASTIEKVYEQGDCWTSEEENIAGPVETAALAEPMDTSNPGPNNVKISDKVRNILP